MFRKKLLLSVVAMLLTSLCCSAWGAKKITVKTIPETATIFIDGQAVGKGSYKVKFDGGNEFYIVTVVADGYIGRRYRLLKSNPNNTVVYRLNEDEAMKASTGSENGMELANQWFDITCRRGMSEDMVWKRLMSIATRYFSNIEVRDKAAGWIKTQWAVTEIRSSAGAHTSGGEDFIYRRGCGYLPCTHSVGD